MPRLSSGRACARSPENGNNRPARCRRASEAASPSRGKSPGPPPRRFADQAQVSQEREGSNPKMAHARSLSSRPHPCKRSGAGSSCARLTKEFGEHEADSIRRLPVRPDWHATRLIREVQGASGHSGITLPAFPHGGEGGFGKTRVLGMVEASHGSRMVRGGLAVSWVSLPVDRGAPRRMRGFLGFSPRPPWSSPA